MAIYAPGYRPRRGKRQVSQRSVVAVLSLTAMVDLFTVLVVFLLQNYAVTGQVIEIPKGVELPKAASVKELRPAAVVVVARDRVLVDNQAIADLTAVRDQKDWIIPAIRDRIMASIKKAKEAEESMTGQLKEAVSTLKTGKDEPIVPDYRRVTLQADKNIEFITVKKVMYSITQAGIIEINFAVMKDDRALETAAPETNTEGS